MKFQAKYIMARECVINAYRYAISSATQGHVQDNQRRIA